MSTAARTCTIVGMVALASIGARAQAQEVPAPYKEVLTFLGKQGDFKDGVLKVNIPRNDVAVTVKGVKTPTPFGFGGWVALTKGAAMDVMMGDLVLLQDEVNPVMSALLENGIEVTALHNHFFWDEPRMYYMHVHGHGTAADLAAKLKPAIDMIGHVAGARGITGTTGSAPPAAAPAAPQIDAAKLARIVGHQGEQNGAVYKITVGRDDLKVNEMGAAINARPSPISIPVAVSRSRPRQKST